MDGTHELLSLPLPDVLPSQLHETACRLVSSFNPSSEC